MERCDNLADFKRKVKFFEELLLYLFYITENIKKNLECFTDYLSVFYFLDFMGGPRFLQRNNPRNDSLHMSPIVLYINMAHPAFKYDVFYF